MMMIPGDKLPRFRLILADFRQTSVDKRPTNYGKPTELPAALRQNFCPTALQESHSVPLKEEGALPNKLTIHRKPSVLRPHVDTNLLIAAHFRTRISV